MRKSRRAGKSYCDSPNDFAALPSRAFVEMHDHWYANETRPARSVFSGRLHAVHLYDSLAVYVRGKQAPLTRLKRGSDWFPNTEQELNPAAAYG